MAENHGIAVIGDWNSVMGFKALGLETYPASDPEEAKKIVEKLASESCAVIYLTEELAVGMSDVINKYKDALLPAIILIPGSRGSLGIGKAEIQRSIERAVGVDIL